MIGHVGFNSMVLENVSTLQTVTHMLALFSFAQRVEQVIAACIKDTKRCIEKNLTTRSY